MWAEITKDAFYALAGNIDFTWRRDERGELAARKYYRHNGVRLQTVYNFVSETTQYYVEDINS